MEGQGSCKTKPLLDRVRVLDLAGEEGLLCGRILGDLGADVIKIEPPGGDPVRNKGPFYKAVPHPERSLLWFALNANKRGITLNIQTTQGKEIYRNLLEKTDVVIDASPPGLEEKGLIYEELKEVNPSIILVSITPFGFSGPYENFKTSELVSLGMSGWLYLCGDSDRPPVQISHPQAYLNAGLDAAVGAMLALYHWEMTGEGQVVEISTQKSLVLCSFQAIPSYELNETILKRSGRFRTGLVGYVKQKQTWPCKDGFVSFSLIGGRAGLQTMKSLVEWMKEGGMSTRFLEEIDWEKLDLAKSTQEFIDQVEQPLEEFFLTRTKAELYEGALKRRMMLYPVCDTKDIWENSQLKAREFWIEVEHPELRDRITYTGPFAKFSGTPLSQKRAPLIGEHNDEIYIGELGLTKKELLLLKQNNII